MKSKLLSQLQKTLIPHQASVVEGTLNLKVLANHKGGCLALMEIGNDKNLEVIVRQAALTYLMTTVRERWELQERVEGYLPIYETEKKQMRENLYKCLLCCYKTPRILRLYKPIITYLFQQDHTGWQPYPQLLLHLQKGPAESFSSLYFLHAMISCSSNLNYYLIELVRDWLNQFVGRVLPGLLVYVTQQNSFESVYWVMKIVYKALKNLERVKEEVVKWVEVVVRVIGFSNGRQLANEEVGEGTEEWYECHGKKWALRILLKFIFDLANPYQQQSLKSNIHTLFYTHHSQKVLKNLLACLSTPLPNKPLSYSLSCLAKLCAFKPHLFQPYAFFLLYTKIPQILAAHCQDQQLITTTEEYIDRTHYVWCLSRDNAEDLRMAATELWMQLSRVKGERGEEFMDGNLRWVREKVQNGCMLEKQIAIYLFTRISHKLKGSQCQIASQLRDSLLPYLQSPSPLLRTRILQALKSYNSFPFQSPTQLHNTISRLYTSLSSQPNPSANILSFIAFNKILRHHQAVKIVKPHVNAILYNYMEALTKYDSYELLLNLEEFVDVFINQPVQCGGLLLYNLLVMFGRVYADYAEKREKKEKGSEGDLKKLARCIQTVTKVLALPIEEQELLKYEIEVCITVELSMGEYGENFFEETMDFFAAYLNRLKKIPDKMWWHFAAIIYYVVGVKDKKETTVRIDEQQKAVLGNLREERPFSLSTILGPLKLYIFKGSHTICSGSDFFNTPYLDLLFLILQFVQQFQLQLQCQPQQTSNHLIMVTSLLLHLLQCTQLSPYYVEKSFQLFQDNNNRYNEQSESYSHFLSMKNTEMFMVMLYRYPKVICGKLVKGEEELPEIVRGVMVDFYGGKGWWQNRRYLLGLSTMIRNCQVLPLNDLVQPLFSLTSQSLQKTLKHRKIDLQLSVSQTTEQSDSEFDYSQQYLFILQDSLWLQNLQKHDPFGEIDEVEYFENCLNEVKVKHPEVFERICRRFTGEELGEISEGLSLGRRLFGEKRREREEKGEKGKGIGDKAILM